LDAQEVFTVVEKLPAFPGGDAKLFEYLRGCFRFPKKAEYQGSIYLSFTIDTTGKVRNACVLNSKGQNDLTPSEKEMLRIIKEMPAWLPGEQNGKRVPVHYDLPIKFRTNQALTNPRGKQ